MAYLISLLFVVCVVLSAALPVSSTNNSPIVGIFTSPIASGECVTLFRQLEEHVGRPLSSAIDHATLAVTTAAERPLRSLPLSLSTPEATANVSSCVWSYYVQWLQQGGARVALVPYDSSPTQLKEMFSSINGLLFTGGDLELDFEHTYTINARYMYDLALSANANGDYFPVWGTCEGFQLLCVLGSSDVNILTNGIFDSENYSIPLVLTAAGASDNVSRIFGNATMPASIKDILTTQNVTLNLHQDGVTPWNFTNNANLSTSFRMLSTDKDRLGNEFVSTIEHVDYPIYGTQWHPERPQFEWSALGQNHSLASVLANQHMANFFVAEARQNYHAFPSTQAEDDALVWSYDPVVYGYTGETLYFVSYPQ